MKASEENIDNRIKNIMREGAIEHVPTHTFTTNVMAQVSELALAQSKAKDKKKQIFFGGLGFLALGLVTTTLLFLWQSGVVQPILSQVWSIAMSLFSKLPVTISPWFVGGLALHLIFFRGVMAFYLVNKHRKAHVRMS